MPAPKGKYAWTATLGDEERGIAIPPKSAFENLFGTAFNNGKDVDDK